MEKTTYKSILRLVATTRVAVRLSGLVCVFVLLLLSSVNVTAANATEVDAFARYMPQIIMPHVASQAYIPPDAKLADIPIPLCATYKQPAWSNPPGIQIHDYRFSDHSISDKAVFAVLRYNLFKEYCTP